MTRDIDLHFSTIASQYTDLRTTDLQVVEFVANHLNSQMPVRVASVGCGTGRYEVELLLRLGRDLDLICVDRNFRMLCTLQEELRQRTTADTQAVHATAHRLPFKPSRLDAVLTFNAIHHFEASGFFRECARTLKPGALLVVYTRLRSQNERNIWGTFFPSFFEREDRLFEKEQVEGLLEDIPNLDLEEVRALTFDRDASLHWLLAQVRNHHYSTFNLYSPSEFEAALERFQENVREHFPDTAHITWKDENTLLVIRRQR